MNKRTHTLQTVESLSSRAERALEHGHINKAARLVHKLENTPYSERVDILRAATTILSGDVQVSDEIDRTPEFSEAVLQLVCSSMISLRLRDEKLTGVLGFKKRDTQFGRGAQYLAIHNNPDRPIAVDVLLPGDAGAIPGKQVHALEDLLGVAHEDRNRRSLNPLSH